eukprot:CAMPEP_0115488930 /NCGR_PEP_ID=MMETSP0271-20121206/61743_1 /TAXON_ID=71861 /ORGANISM="Scrippsiella trochoidea, Strain CCMP3099" /LENGTH=66 /DNA_ID=CAMNT_0002917063 /DNA_START=39 /DNA_END=236 /DNA_ORIENTATION=-
MACHVCALPPAAPGALPRCEARLQWDGAPERTWPSLRQVEAAECLWACLPHAKFHGPKRARDVHSK